MSTRRSFLGGVLGALAGIPLVGRLIPQVKAAPEAATAPSGNFVMGSVNNCSILRLSSGTGLLAQLLDIDQDRKLIRIERLIAPRALIRAFYETYGIRDCSPGKPSLIVEEMHGDCRRGFEILNATVGQVGMSLVSDDMVVSESVLIGFTDCIDLGPIA